MQSGAPDRSETGAKECRTKHKVILGKLGTETVASAKMWAQYLM